LQAVLLEFLERFEEAGFLRRVDLHAQDAGEFTAEAAHAAFQPVAAVIGHNPRNGFHETGAVRPDDGHHQGSLHGRKTQGWLVIFCQSTP
jgi:hypothetical protein